MMIGCAGGSKGICVEGGTETIESSDISWASSTLIAIGIDHASLTVENNWIHGSERGIDAQIEGGWLYAHNNLFVDMRTTWT